MGNFEILSYCITCLFGYIKFLSLKLYKDSVNLIFAYLLINASWESEQYTNYGKWNFKLSLSYLVGKDEKVLISIHSILRELKAHFDRYMFENRESILVNKTWIFLIHLKKVMIKNWFDIWYIAFIKKSNPTLSDRFFPKKLTIWVMCRQVSDQYNSNLSYRNFQSYCFLWWFTNVMHLISNISPTKQITDLF